MSKFNGEITTRLLDGALTALEQAGVERRAIDVMPVPGAFELPLAAMALAKTRRYACVIALGCVIRGETPHFEYISAEAASGLQLAALETGVPVSFGVLTCETREQAFARLAGLGATRAPTRPARRSRWPTSSRASAPASAARPAVARLSRASLHCSPMSKVCAICGKGPAFGHNRSHSMVATRKGASTRTSSASGSS